MEEADLADEQEGGMQSVSGDLEVFHKTEEMDGISDVIDSSFTGENFQYITEDVCKGISRTDHGGNGCD